MKKRTIILIAAIGITAGIESEMYARPGFDYRPSKTAIQYGTDRTLSWREVDRFKSLSYPQSRRAITRTFGSGSYRDRDNDYYRLPNGRFLTVRYSERRAVNFSY
jgi:hypothetical protein